MTQLETLDIFSRVEAAAVEWKDHNAAEAKSNVYEYGVEMARHFIATRYVHIRPSPKLWRRLHKTTDTCLRTWDRTKGRFYAYYSVCIRCMLTRHGVDGIRRGK